ncbi:uncharacterized protein LOC108669468 isoform X2 [Hyalella azteca]|nr:uncharacterized protein LOC108669468 isoform X2 [Hyalella azteca]
MEPKKVMSAISAMPSAIFLQDQVAILKAHQGQECDAKTILQLQQLCSAIQTAARLLLRALSPPAALIARVTTLLEQLSNLTTELHRDGGIEVRDNSEVWRDLGCSFEDLVSSILKCLDLWLEKRLGELHTHLSDIKNAVKNLRTEILSKFICKDELYSLVLTAVRRISGGVQKIQCWMLFMPDQSKEILSIWMMQLYAVILMLPQATVVLAHCHCTNERNAKILNKSCASLLVVLKRLEEIMDEIRSTTSLKCVNGNKKYDENSQGGFLKAVDEVLELLSQTSLRPDDQNVQPEQQNTEVDEVLNRCSKEQEFSRHPKISDGNSIDAHRVDLKKNSPSKCVLDNSTPLSQRVKGPLEEILRHVISIAYCSSQDDSKIIMSQGEKLLSCLKKLVDVESSNLHISKQDFAATDGYELDFMMACEDLSECVEKLEQTANTCLIRCYVRSFASVTEPFNKLISSYRAESDSCKSRDASSSRSLPHLQECVADLDEHIDKIFQIVAFAAASSTDKSRSSTVRHCLLSLEWLESELVTFVLQQHAHPQTKDDSDTWCSKQHIGMLTKHWTEAALVLQRCLDASLDPAAFVMVTQSEVHAAWWEVKQNLYSQDVAIVHEPVRRVLNLVKRVVVDMDAADGFLNDLQKEQFSKARQELNRSMTSVLGAPENLRLRRSLLKRVQLTLTLLTRLSSSLHSSTLRQNSALQQHVMHPNLDAAKSNYAAEKRKITVSKTVSTEHAPSDWLFSSDIANIPRDVATPFQNSSLSGKIPVTSRTPCVNLTDEASCCGKDITEDATSAVNSNPTPKLNSESSVAKTNGNIKSYLNSEENIEDVHFAYENSDNKTTCGDERKNSCVVSSVRDALSPPTPNFWCNVENGSVDSMCDDTTFDLTRLLAANPQDASVRSSIRASVRSRLLKGLRGASGRGLSPRVKGINVDLTGFLSPASKSTVANGGVRCQPSQLPPLPARTARRIETNNKPHVEDPNSLPPVGDCVSVIEELSKAQVDVDEEHHPAEEEQGLVTTSLVQELTGLLENLTSLASSFTSCSPACDDDGISASKPARQNATQESSEVQSIQTSSNKSTAIIDDTSLGYILETFEKSDQATKLVNELPKDGSEVLRGIKLHGISFSPKFPDIESKDSGEISFDISHPLPTDSKNLTGNSAVWENFTLIVDDETTQQRRMLKFVDKFMSTNQVVASLIQEVDEEFSGERNLQHHSKKSNDESKSTITAFVETSSKSKCIEKIHHANSDCDTKQTCQGTSSVSTASQETSAVTASQVSYSMNGIASFKSSVASVATPDSVAIDSPQRMFDIQTLRSKLAKLRYKFSRY